MTILRTSKPLMPGRLTSSSIRSTSSFSIICSAGFAGGGAQHAVVAPQHRGQRLAHPLVVVDDEDGLAAFGHAGREYNAAP